MWISPPCSKRYERIRLLVPGHFIGPVVTGGNINYFYWLCGVKASATHIGLPPYQRSAGRGWGSALFFLSLLGIVL